MLLLLLIMTTVVDTAACKSSCSPDEALRDHINSLEDIIDSMELEISRTADLIRSMRSCKHTLASPRVGKWGQLPTPQPAPDSNLCKSDEKHAGSNWGGVRRVLAESGFHCTLYNVGIIYTFLCPAVMTYGTGS